MGGWRYIRSCVFVGRNNTEQNLCPSVHFLSSPLPESHLSSSLHPPIPFPSPALCSTQFPFQHSITAARSPGDVSLLRSDVVDYANGPSRPLLLTRPGPHFSRPTETQPHAGAQTHKKSRKKAQTHENPHRHLAQFVTGDKQTLHVFLC